MIKHHTFPKASASDLITYIARISICVYRATSGRGFQRGKNFPQISGGKCEFHQRGGAWGGARISPPTKYNVFGKGECYE